MGWCMAFQELNQRRRQISLRFHPQRPEMQRLQFATSKFVVAIQ
jgi:hypothetical protein